MAGSNFSRVCEYPRRKTVVTLEALNVDTILMLNNQISKVLLRSHSMVLRRAFRNTSERSRLKVVKASGVTPAAAARECSVSLRATA